MCIRDSLQLVLHNLPPGDWAAGERGIACIPGREDEFRAGVAKAAEYAPLIGVQRWHCMAGLMPAGVSESQARATWVSNVRFAAAAAKRTLDTQVARACDSLTPAGMRPAMQCQRCTPISGAYSAALATPARNSSSRPGMQAMPRSPAAQSPGGRLCSTSCRLSLIHI